MSDTTLYLVFSDPMPGTEDEFNRWYDQVHVPDILATPGVVSARRYRVQVPEIIRESGRESTHGYLLVYELDRDPDEVMTAIREGVASGATVMSDSLDLESITMSYWQPIGPKLTKADL